MFPGLSTAIKSPNFAFLANPFVNYQDVTAGWFEDSYKKKGICFINFVFFPYFLLVLPFLLKAWYRKTGRIRAMDFSKIMMKILSKKNSKIILL